MNNPRKQGYDKYFEGKELNDNPYPRDSQSSREWEAGNWEAYDDYKRQREEREQ